MDSKNNSTSLGVVVMAGKTTASYNCVAGCSGNVLRRPNAG